MSRQERRAGRAGTREPDRSTMGRAFYVLLHGLFGCALGMGFYAQLFCPISLPLAGQLTLGQSRLLLWALALGGTLLGLLRSIARRRTYPNLFLTVTAPYGAYLVLGVLSAPSLRTAPGGLLALWLLFVGGYALVLIRTPIRSPRRALVMHRRLDQLVRLSALALRLVCSAALMAALGGWLLGAAASSPDQARTWGQDGDQSDPLAVQAGALTGLRQENWARLVPRERLALLQQVARLETEHLGIPDQVSLCCRTLGQYTLGGYDHGTRTILVDESHLLDDTALSCLDTVLHEMYHSYQYHLCALYQELDQAYQAMYFLRDAAQYAAEFEDYAGGDQFSDYYSQACEQDARAYAESRSLQYCQALGLTGAAQALALEGGRQSP